MHYQSWIKILHTTVSTLAWTPIIFIKGLYVNGLRAWNLEKLEGIKNFKGTRFTRDRNDSDSWNLIGGRLVLQF